MAAHPEEDAELAAVPRDIEQFRQNTRSLFGAVLSVFVEKLNDAGRCGFWLDDRTRERVDAALAQIKADLKTAPMVMDSEVREQAIAQIRAKHARLDPAVQQLLAAACAPSSKRGGRHA